MKNYQFVKSARLDGKSISINDLPEEAWITVGGNPVKDSDMHKYYKSIPWLFRGVDIRVNAVQSMPFSIYQGETEIDNSDNYQNAVGFMPHPSELFGIIEASLTLWGYAYLFKKRNVFMQKGLRYLLPSTIKYEVDKESGVISFTRKVGGETLDYTEDDIVYFWKPDAYVEKGPPTSSPALVVGNACGVLFNVDEFAKAFWKGGAVKTTLLFTEGINDPAERERLKTTWGKIAQGIRTAWASFIFNAKSVTPVTIGEGLESLQDNDLTEAKRIDIAAGLGIPYSVLFSNASNRATAEQDDLHLYSKTIIPECEFIEEVLNEQVFEPLGYTLSFTPDNLDVMQEDENARSASMTQLVAALDKPQEFLWAASILGYELDPDIEKAIKASVAEKEKQRVELAQNKPPVTGDTQIVADEIPPGTTQSARAVALDKWRAKSIKRVKAKRGAVCPFSDKALDPVTIASISGALENCETVTDVDAVFSNTWVGYP